MDHILPMYKIRNIQNHMEFLLEIPNAINAEFLKCLFFKNPKSSKCVIHHLNSTIIHPINWVTSPFS